MVGGACFTRSSTDRAPIHNDTLRYIAEASSSPGPGSGRIGYRRNRGPVERSKYSGSLLVVGQGSKHRKKKHRRVKIAFEEGACV